MSITPAEIQQALRISKAIEEYLEHVRTVNVNSTEIYSMLAEHKLVERDTTRGNVFRTYLTKLAKEHMLNLIPQCKAMPRSGGKFDFTFNRAASRMPARKAVDGQPEVKKEA
ncbi:MAG: hypothetical protein LKM36_08045 [Flavobacteriales bacterium]|jgi:hypothetical protein|nr:hypothetical protein [Flavobacteriales bacterium]MCI1752802.1 hypothetical protein [Flavobacteriales bacterium]